METHLRLAFQLSDKNKHTAQFLILGPSHDKNIIYY